MKKIKDLTYLLKEKKNTFREFPQKDCEPNQLLLLLYIYMKLITKKKSYIFKTNTKQT